jgi:hypothetical protein
MEVNRYGDLFWKVHAKDLESDGQRVAIQLNGDRIEVTANGDLLVWGHSANDKEAKYVVWAFARGTWTHYYAASCISSDPIVIDHWQETKTGK